MQPALAFVAGLAAGDDEVMLIAGVLEDVEPLLGDVALHAAADRRVELGDVANLHGKSSAGGTSWQDRRRRTDQPIVSLSPFPLTSKSEETDSPPLMRLIASPR